MGGVVIVSGLPGVGKSTVLNIAIEQLRSEGLRVELVNYGTVMLEEALRNKLVKHRDEMRKLKVAEQLRLQRLAAEKLYELSKEVDLLLVDTHLFILTPRGRWPGLSVNNLSELDVKQVIVVEADPKEIIQRRLSDKSRIREMETPDSILDDLQYNRYLAAALSVFTSSPVVFIPNHTGKAEEAAEAIYKVLRKLADEL